MHPATIRVHVGHRARWQPSGDSEPVGERDERCYVRFIAAPPLIGLKAGEGRGLGASHMPASVAMSCMSFAARGETSNRPNR